MSICSGRPAVLRLWTPCIARFVSDACTSAATSNTGGTVKGRDGQGNRLTRAAAAAACRPDFDFDFLLNPDNMDAIRRNAEDRQHDCSIEALHRAWAELQGSLHDKTLKSPSDSGALLRQKWDTLYAEAARLPNMTHEMAPRGENKVVKVFGEKQEKWGNAKMKTLEQLCRKSRTLRTDVTFACGDRSYVLLAPIARLEQALIDYTIDFVLTTDPEFKLINVPDVVGSEVVEACGLGSRMATGLSYHLTPGRVLSGTAEAGIATHLAGTVFDYDQLPVKLLAVSKCYRPEAHGGKDEQWLYRVHEFNKVEMFIVSADPSVNPSKSEPTPAQLALSQLVALQASLYSSLQLHFRLVDMAGKELGAAAARKFDIEAWMPGRKMWGEISSASDCADYQSRRLGVKYRCPHTNHLLPASTCNATAAAGCRLLISLVETFQSRRGPIDVPKVLRPYLEEEPGPGFEQCRLKMTTKEIRNVF